MDPALALSPTTSAPNVTPAERRTNSPAAAVATHYRPGVAVPGSLVALPPRIPPAHTAAGGFSTVIEASSALCLRVVASALGEPELEVRFGAEELRALRDTAPFASAELNDRVIPAGGRGYALVARLTPADLYFKDPRRVCIRLWGELALAVETIPDPPRPKRPPIGWNHDLERPDADDQPPEWMPRDARKEAEWTRSRSWTHAIPAGEVTMPSWPSIQLPLTPIVRLGTMTVEICAPYDFTQDAARLRVLPHADLSRAEVAVAVPAGDARRLYDQFAAPRTDELHARLLPESRLALTPRLSPAGRSSLPVPGFPNVDVRVFHVGAQPWQALVVAYDFKPGCVGTIEDVLHFIGGADYGIVADEWTLDRVCKARWGFGGFLRTAPLSKTIQVQRNGRQEDATLRGVVDFTSLEAATIEVDANARADIIRLSGRGRTRASDVLLRDGTVVVPEGIGVQQEDVNWSVATELAMEESAAVDPLLREFARRASHDATMHLTRPFSNTNAALRTEPVLGQVEGVTRHLMALGDVVQLFS